MQQPRKDPVTGDVLSSGEYVSWVIQGIIRRWSFLIVILVITAAAWATGNDRVLLWWNLSASLLAIVIEAIVGKGMFGQTHRDAVVIRETRAMSQHLEEQDAEILKILTKLQGQEELIVQLIEKHEVK